MSVFFNFSSLFLIGAGFLCLLLAVARFKKPKIGARFMLDLWLAAGLIRLSADLDWKTLMIVAGLIIVRKLIVGTWYNLQIKKSTFEAV